MTRNRCFMFVLVAGCAPQVVSPSDHISSAGSALSGCHGTASSSIPTDGTYYLTTFGGPGDSGTMSCGESTSNGSWYYMASRQRFGCGAHVQLTANGNCVVAEADDYGPDICVETAAGKPVIDASPLVAKALFGQTAAGWSDHELISAQVVDSSTPLGACTTSSSSTNDGGVTGSTTDAGSSSSNPSPSNPTSDPTTDPTTTDPTTDPTTAPADVTCQSATLGIPIPAGECVQSASDDNWYQCTSDGWIALYDDGSGPLGDCTAAYSLDDDD